MAEPQQKAGELPSDSDPLLVGYRTFVGFLC
jgi:hypothetical protein